MRSMIFKNRQSAGEKLAEALAQYKSAKDAIILALPRGGVVVGHEVAKRLGLPLDIVVPRKIGAPGNPEYAIGAITEAGEGVFNEEETRRVDQGWLKNEIAKEKAEAERRLKTYRGDKPYPELTGKIIIIVDDGVATGYTMRAAIKSVRVKNPKKIVVAVPHGAADSLTELRKEADEVIALEEPEWYGAVGAFYQEFGQTSDEEVIALLQNHNYRSPTSIIQTNDEEVVAFLNNKQRTTNNEQRNKNNQQKTKIYTLFIVVCLLLIAGALANELYRPHNSYKSHKSVEIAPGLGSRKIAEVLKKEGVIRSKWTFVAYVSLKNLASNLKPGNYVFGRASIPEIVHDLVRGGTNERIITIPEGWSTKDIAEYLEKEGVTLADVFLKLTDAQHPVSDAFSFLKNKPKSAGLEGYLFPDTYRIFKDAKPEDVIEKMLENFGKKLTPDLRTEISRRNLTTFDVVRMASLIEKEVVSDEDRAIVSGILWKRLNLGIALQVDASIVYITGNKKVSLNDLQAKSPYNTYRNRGLPLGPISNPGLSAIKASIYPKTSPYLYYLSAPDGQTIFSKTLEEHNEAKAKYLTQ